MELEAMWRANEDGSISGPAAQDDATGGYFAVRAACDHAKLS
jgi:hypothetical protein